STWGFANERGFIWSFDRAVVVADAAVVRHRRAAARHRDAADVTGTPARCRACDGTSPSIAPNARRPRGDAGFRIRAPGRAELGHLSFHAFPGSTWSCAIFTSGSAKSSGFTYPRVMDSPIACSWALDP